MKKILVFNHKANLTKDEINKYILNFNEKVPSDLNVIVCPCVIYLPYFDGRYRFNLGAQNIGFNEFTGEVTPHQLRSLNVKYALIGHSERKNYLKEDALIINKKIIDTVKGGITPIVFVGETKEERLLNKTGLVLTRQIREYFKNCEVTPDFVIAYEPTWAVGTRTPIKLKNIEDTVDMIKEIVFRLFDSDIQVIYGGGVTENNINAISRVKNVDGVIVGKISSDIKSVNEIFKSI